jgi:tRNA(Ile)-lysidine synthase
MLENIELVLSNECKLVKDRPIIVGVSGGPDSLCLMEILRQTGYKVIVAHFDHQLRPESSQDARAVERTAGRFMLPSVIDSADVRAAHADTSGSSIEEVARNLRYRFMFDLARKHNAQAVAVGHTVDDQVETVLMHFLRGSGLSGLKGMSHRSIIKTFDEKIPIVRPLLDVWREETMLFCAANKLHPHHDASNDFVNFQRNRIRHLLIPLLESYNSNFRESIYRMSQVLKSDYSLLMETLENAWLETVTRSAEDAVTFDSFLLSKCSLGLQKNLLRRAMQTLRPDIDLDFETLERAANFLNDPDEAPRMDLKAGLRIIREVHFIYVCTYDADLPFKHWPQMPGTVISIPVIVPGQAELEGGWKLTCERWRIPALAREQAEKNEDQFQVWLDADTLPPSLELRCRHQGDQFAPLGMDGHLQKLSDFMINEKMPQRARERWPLLASANTIVWIPGYRPAHPFRLTVNTRNIVYFAMSRLEKSHSSE